MRVQFCRASCPHSSQYYFRVLRSIATLPDNRYASVRGKVIFPKTVSWGNVAYSDSICYISLSPSAAFHLCLVCLLCSVVRTHGQILLYPSSFMFCSRESLCCVFYVLLFFWKHISWRWADLHRSPMLLYIIAVVRYIVLLEPVAIYIHVS